MSQPLITAEMGVRAQIFHDGRLRGLRGITLLRKAGPRGLTLYVSVLDAAGKRHAMTTFGLIGNDFHVQWARAVDRIAEYHGVDKTDPLYAEMLASWETFVDRYSLELKPVTVQYQYIGASIKEEATQ